MIVSVISWVAVEYTVLVEVWAGSVEISVVVYVDGAAVDVVVIVSSVEIVEYLSFLVSRALSSLLIICAHLVMVEAPSVLVLVIVDAGCVIVEVTN